MREVYIRDVTATQYCSTTPNAQTPCRRTPNRDGTSRALIDDDSRNHGDHEFGRPFRKCSKGRLTAVCRKQAVCPRSQRRRTRHRSLNILVLGTAMYVYKGARDALG